MLLLIALGIQLFTNKQHTQYHSLTWIKSLNIYRVLKACNDRRHKLRSNRSFIDIIVLSIKLLKTNVQTELASTLTYSATCFSKVYSELGVELNYRINIIFIFLCFNWTSWMASFLSTGAFSDTFLLIVIPYKALHVVHAWLKQF